MAQRRLAGSPARPGWRQPQLAVSLAGVLAVVLVHSDTQPADRWFAGMMATSQLRTLAATSGQRFDFLFVDMLLEHYKGAIVMADGVLTDGRDAEVALLASRTVTYSQRAIGQLSSWRRRWAEPFLRELTPPAAQSMPAFQLVPDRPCSAPHRDVHVVVVAQRRVTVAGIRRVPVGVPAFVSGPDAAVEDHILHISAQALSAAEFATRQPSARPWKLG